MRVDGPARDVRSNHCVGGTKNGHTCVGHMFQRFVGRVAEAGPRLDGTKVVSRVLVGRPSWSARVMCSRDETRRQNLPSELVLLFGFGWANVHRDVSQRTTSIAPFPHIDEKTTFSGAGSNGNYSKPHTHTHAEHTPPPLPSFPFPPSLLPPHPSSLPSSSPLPHTHTTHRPPTHPPQQRPHSPFPPWPGRWEFLSQTLIDRQKKAPTQT